MYKNTIDNDWAGDCIELPRGVSTSDTYYGRYIDSDDNHIIVGSGNVNINGGRGTIVVYDTNGNIEDTLFGGDVYGYGTTIGVYNGTIIARYDNKKTQETKQLRTVSRKQLRLMKY